MIRCENCLLYEVEPGTLPRTEVDRIIDFVAPPGIDERVQVMVRRAEGPEAFSHGETKLFPNRIWVWIANHRYPRCFQVGNLPAGYLMSDQSRHGYLCPGPELQSREEEMVYMLAHEFWHVFQARKMPSKDTDEGRATKYAEMVQEAKSRLAGEDQGPLEMDKSRRLNLHLGDMTSIDLTLGEKWYVERDAERYAERKLQEWRTANGESAS